MSSPSNKLPEERPTHAYQRTAFFDGDLVVVGHAHRQAGAEALIRWSSPDLGLVHPKQFVPIAEHTGLIHPIGTWVMEQACRQAQRWLQDGLGGVCVAVNLSPCQFSGATVAEDVGRVLHTTGLPAHLLELELTESTVMQDLAAVAFLAISAGKTPSMLAIMLLLLVPLLVWYRRRRHGPTRRISPGRTIAVRRSLLR